MRMTRALIILVTLLIGNLTFASEKPEIVLQVGHTKNIENITYRDNEVASIARVEFGELKQLEVKLWDISVGRLKKDFKLTEHDLEVRDGLEIFFLKDEDKLLILIDKREKFLSLLKLDLDSGLVVERTDMLYQDFLNKLSEFLRLEYLKEGSSPEVASFYVNEKKEMVKKFGIIMLTKNHFENFLNFNGYKVFINHTLYEGERQYGDFEVDFSKEKLKVKTSYKHIEIPSIKEVPSPIITGDKSYLIGVTGEGPFNLRIVCYDLKTGEKKSEFGNPTVRQEWLIKGKFERYLVSYDYHDKTGFSVWDIKNGSYLGSGDLKKVYKYLNFAEKDPENNLIVTQHEIQSKDQRFIAKVMPPYIYLVNKANNKEVARFILFKDGEWIVITPEGYFNASPNGARHLNVRIGNRVYSIDNFYEKFFNPVYVASVLQGKKVEAVADIRKGVLTPPEVRIISPQPNTEFKTDTITITVSAKDTGGGIDEIRLYHNGKAVGEDQRAVKIVPKGNEVIKDYTVTLVDGINTFKAVGFSKDRTESNPYELIVRLSAPQKEVSLYVFVVGINKYRNPALNLNYAEPDAKGIVDFFRQKGVRLFKKIKTIEIYNEQATKDNINTRLKQLEKPIPRMRLSSTLQDMEKV